MKKMTFMACAALLTSIVALNSCKSDEQLNPSQPTEVVKTEFAISMPNQAVGSNRMPGAAVQTEGITNFQDMTGIILIPFIHKNIASPKDSITTASKRLGANIHLADLVKADVNGKNNKAKLYSNVSIPLTTGSFLFYANSKRNDSNNKFSNGSLLADTTSALQPEDFAFCLEPIQSAANVTTFMGADKEGGKLLAYLTSVATASDTMAVGSKHWYEYPTTGDSLAMHNLFDTLTTMHGLSSFEVERALTDLYKSLKPIRETNAMAKGVLNAINNPTYATITNDTVHLVTTPLDLTNFPRQYNLPEGSIDIAWNSGEHAFKVGAYSDMARPESYVYPAQLWYRANSSLKTSNNAKEASLYTNTTNTWGDILGQYTNGNYVSPRTRSVAITDVIQYAVARLDVQVRLKEENMADNSEAVEGVATAVDCSAGFPVTAILVGGQKNVGFDFTHATLNAGHETYAKSYTVYDTLMANDILAEYSTSTYSALNHTLVLENGNEDVMIAIEMKNTTGKDFYGASGQLIPKNSKFYVVAKLESKAATAGGVTVNTPNQVFKQDYTTLAKLTLKDLKTAYNTIPDLRTPQLQIGFSVDLSWETGNIYEIEF